VNLPRLRVLHVIEIVVLDAAIAEKLM